MKKYYLSLFLMCFLSASPLFATQKDTIFVADYGVTPDTYENQTERLEAAIADCKRFNSKVLMFEKGRYDLWTEGATYKKFFITNTSSESECPSKIKTIGMFFEDMEGLTIEGNDATLMFHGKVTMLAFEHCKKMTLQNIHIDFERPGGSELTLTQINEKGVVAKFHPDSRYAIKDGKITLYGEGWRTNIPHCIEYNPTTEHFYYSQAWNVLAKAKATELAPHVVLFETTDTAQCKLNHTLTIRDIIRDQVGILIYESEDITFKNVGVHYMHGLGIVSQFSKNVEMNHVYCMPRQNSGRLLASSADFMHFSGCSGKVKVVNCKFAGAQDDCINVHGTNLRIMEKVNDYTLKLRFMHPQTYGFNAFFEGDTVAFVRPSTMQRYAQAVIKTAKLLSNRIVEVTLSKPIQHDIELQSDCLENMTCTPEVEIRNCYFTRTSTRGILVTTPRRAVISENVFYKTGMSAILIEGDAAGWYESGPVKDVLIENNTFLDCANNNNKHAVIELNPSNTDINEKRPVHQNVRIINNRFTSYGQTILSAKSTSNLVFRNNEVTMYRKSSDTSSKWFSLNGCSKVKFKANQLLVRKPIEYSCKL